MRDASQKEKEKDRQYGRSCWCDINGDVDQIEEKKTVTNAPSYCCWSILLLVVCQQCGMWRETGTGGGKSWGF